MLLYVGLWSKTSQAEHSPDGQDQGKDSGKGPQEMLVEVEDRT